MEVKEIVERLLELQEKYSLVKRHLVTGDRYEHIHQAGLVTKGDYDHKALRESLLEHVGHLPVLATYLHPHVEHSDQIDLGKVLIMLAIHDIGETEVGDVFTYDKSDADEDAEYKAAVGILELDQLKIYQEYEKQESLEAKYAKAIDALAPITNPMYRPHVKIENFKMRGRTVQDIIDTKAKYYEWDSVLKDIFNICIEHYLQIEKGEDGIFLCKA